MANLKTQIKSVNFYGQEIQTFLNKGKPYVVARTVCEGMGIDWAGQYTKLKSNWGKFSCCVISTTASDGKKYNTISVPLTHLNSWLLSINPNRVREDVRDDLIKYQEESAQALYNYWNQGQATNPRSFERSWQKAREEGRVIRMDETSTIKEFISYAQAQGSQNSHWYYRNITRMTYAGLSLIEDFHAECEDLRTTLQVADLALLSTAENLVRKVLHAGMDANAPYKDIFQVAKQKVLELSASQDVSSAFQKESRLRAVN